uniref:Uncharacterized protein n=1 Tax=Pyxicephalus adspersus TaxID=30357 RepID=A0AAV3AXN8_PYXAD|nr:TPA: hypothetical protein GDO54_007885 [Pyxicephalus adspersus]
MDLEDNNNSKQYVYAAFNEPSTVTNECNDRGKSTRSLGLTDHHIQPVMATSDEAVAVGCIGQIWQLSANHIIRGHPFHLLLTMGSEVL